MSKRNRRGRQAQIAHNICESLSILYWFEFVTNRRKDQITYRSSFSLVDTRSVKHAWNSSHIVRCSSQVAVNGVMSCKGAHWQYKCGGREYEGPSSDSPFSFSSWSLSPARLSSSRVLNWTGTFYYAINDDMRCNGDKVFSFSMSSATGGRLNRFDTDRISSWFVM